LLVFLFGCLTSRTFYFFSSARTSLSMLKASHIIYLSTLIKALEHLSYAREMVLEHMVRTERKSTQISFFEMQHDENIEMFKQRAIDILIYSHPTFFRTMVEFDDWRTAMKYLADNKEAALKFWEA